MDINPAGTHYATAGKDRTIRIYDEETQKLSLKLNPSSYGSLGHNNRIFAVKFNPEDPNVLLSGSWDGCIGFWDLRDKSAYGMVQGTEISGDALDIKNNRILTGSYRKENQLELWDYINRKKLRNIYWENDHNPKNALIYGCQFSKKDDKTILAGCCGLDQVRCFDPDNGYKYFGTSGDYKHKIYSVDFANNKDLFAYCGSDGYVHTVKLLSEVLN